MGNNDSATMIGDYGEAVAGLGNATGAAGTLGNNDNATVIGNGGTTAPDLADAVKGNNNNATTFGNDGSYAIAGGGNNNNATTLGNQSAAVRRDWQQQHRHRARQPKVKRTEADPITPVPATDCATVLPLAGSWKTRPALCAASVGRARDEKPCHTTG
jgi:hypothetical protein